jgi:Uma2 family endonuclease
MNALDPDTLASRRTRAAEGIDRRAFTVDEAVRMVEAGILDPDEKFELIDGEIVPMSPEAMRHARLKGLLNRVIVRALTDEFMVAPDSTLYVAGYRKGRTFLEPDLYVYPEAITFDQLNGAGVLLAIEVAASTLDYDLKRKPALYARHGVRELWVIDTESLITHVHLGPGEAGYASITQVPPDAALTPHLLPGLTLRLDDLHDRL